jgi:hypothetical protein
MQAALRCSSSLATSEHVVLIPAAAGAAEAEGGHCERRSSSQRSSIIGFIMFCPTNPQK